MTYSERMQKIFDHYTKETGGEAASLEDVAAWAIKNKLWAPAPKDIIQLCKEDLAASLREEKRTDADGRSYRAKHPVRTYIDGRQYVLWADIDTAPRIHMEKSFAQRRRGIVGNCYQMKQDVDHFNGLHPSEVPIQIAFDFTDDVAEREAIRRPEDDSDMDEVA